MVDKKEALLKEAKLRYPVGCKIKSALCKKNEGSIVTVDNTSCFSNMPNYGNIIVAGKQGGWVYCEKNGYPNQWAEIVEYPKDYKPSSETILNNLELW